MATYIELKYLVRALTLLEKKRRERLNTSFKLLDSGELSEKGKRKKKSLRGCVDVKLQYVCGERQELALPTRHDCLLEPVAR